MPHIPIKADYYESVWYMDTSSQKLKVGKIKRILIKKEYLNLRITYDIVDGPQELLEHQIYLNKEEAIESVIHERFKNCR